MIKKYENVLSDELIENIFLYLKFSLNEYVWKSSGSWDQNLVLNSTNILTHPISRGNLHSKIKSAVQESIKVDFDEENLTFMPLIYLWGGGSYINWHHDNNYEYNGTIYLNKNWDSSDGGIFLYKDNASKSIIGIEPSYNTMVVNSSTKQDPHTEHCVTCILPFVTKKRITIQWRTSLKKKESSFLYK